LVQGVAQIWATRFDVAQGRWELSRSTLCRRRRGRSSGKQKVSVRSKDANGCSCPSFLSHLGHQRILRRRRRSAIHREGDKVFSGNGVWICPPAISMALGAAGSAGESMAIAVASSWPHENPPTEPQRCSGREPLVPMMEPADLLKRHDLSAAAGLNRSPVGCVLAQRKMRSGSVIIIEV